jgi:hypothetical protein
MEGVNLDTVIVVDGWGNDEEFNMRTHPGMIGYIVPSPIPGLVTFQIEIPITRLGPITFRKRNG